MEPKNMNKSADVQVVILNKLRSTSIRIAKWVSESFWIPNTIFLNFPRSSYNLLIRYFQGSIPLQEFWQQFREYYNLTPPFIHAMRYKFDPILQAINFISIHSSYLEIFPYESDYSFQVTTQFSEQILLLLYRARVSKKIALDTWKEVLYDEFQWNRSSHEKNKAFILQNLRGRIPSLIFYQGNAKDLKESLWRADYKVQMKHFGTYWRAPLEVLTYLFALKGFYNVSNSQILRCIKEQLSYLDIILQTPSLDRAHKRWAQRFRILSS
ncbi:MAG: hypothetical protein ACTSRS_15685 [Candidatus Helarchaeota archaeon]